MSMLQGKGPSPPDSGALRRRPVGRAERVLSALAVAAALAAATAMAVRPQTSPDLGYHLAYGEQFLDTFRPVDTNPYVYTNPAPGEPRGPQTRSVAFGDPVRPEPGPGCWYDEAGRYRFPNANWLTQVAMAAAWRLGGFSALCALQVALAAGVFVLVAAALRRLGAGWGAAALGVLLAAFASYPRLNLRPELFGYLILAAQLTVLAGHLGRRDPAAGPIAWRSVAALVVLQLLFVNLHSYFLLGLLLTAAALGDSALRLGWAHHAGWRGLLRRGPAPPDREALRRQTVRLGAALGGQLAVCFLNPWTWRLAVLPFQTVLFLRAGGVGRVPYQESHHPWAIIGEFANVVGPWSPAETKATFALYVLAGLVALAGVACLVRGHWGRLGILAAMSAVAVSMRRNVAPGALVLVPLAVGSLCDWPGGWWARSLPRFARVMHRATCAAAVLLAAGAIGLVVTQRFYTSEELPWRFGWGPSRVMLPLDASEFLTRHHVAGRLWTDYNTGSNFYYFTRPHPPVPAVTNTWAYPPTVMSELLDYLMGAKPFEEARRKYSLQTVAVFAAGFPVTIHALRGDPNWRLVYLDPMYVIYVRADGPNAELARRTIRPETFDANLLIQQARQWDPAPYYTMHMAASTLYHLGWDDQAIYVFRAALAENPNNFRSWNMVAVCHARRAQAALQEWKDLEARRLYAQADGARKAARAGLLEAQRCFLRARDLQRDSPVAATGLENVRQQLEEEQNGQFVPRAFQ